MRKTFTILATSFRMALEELRNNRLRTFLSLFGITIGIFCIIGVLALVDSLEGNVRNELKAMGTNTVYIQKWPWGGGSDYPWWKYVSRPETRFNELRIVKEKAMGAAHVAYVYNGHANIEYMDAALQDVVWYGVTDEYNFIQPIEIAGGRYMSNSEFNFGSPVVVMGYSLAEKLFSDADLAVGKSVEIKGNRVEIIGLIKKQGSSLLGGWDFDNTVYMPYRFCGRFANSDNASGFMMVQGKGNVPVEDLKGELRGVMRSVRRLSPKQDDNFALNDVTSGTSELNAIFSGMTIGGFAITGLSFIVGIFGVANIMFVTVRERTSMIGLKKAIGAKRSTILLEFLMESAFLCVIGGLMGLVMVFLLSFLLTNLLHFQVYISLWLFVSAIGFCVFTGMLAGIIPASIAAKMDPVVAIRSQ